MQSNNHVLYIRKPKLPKNKYGWIFISLYILAIVLMLFIPPISHLLSALPNEAGIGIFLYTITFPLGFLLNPLDNLLIEQNFFQTHTLFTHVYLAITFLTAVFACIITMYWLGVLLGNSILRLKQLKKPGVRKVKRKNQRLRSSSR